MSCPQCENEQDDDISGEVSNWWWNLNIFEIYDRIRNRSKHEQVALLVLAYDTASDGDTKLEISALYYHLIGNDISDRSYEEDR